MKQHSPNDYDEYTVRIYRRHPTEDTSRSSEPNNEYREFLRYLFHVHLERKISQGDLDAAMSEWETLRPRFLSALNQLRRLELTQDDPFSDDSGFLTAEERRILPSLVPTLSQGVSINNRVVVDTGIADVIENFYDDVVLGMSVDDFPAEDIEALRQSGSHDARLELIALIYQAKARGQRPHVSNRGESLATRLRASQELVSPPTDPRGSTQVIQRKSIKRKWYKGVGGLCCGAMLCLVDIGKVAGAMHMLHPDPDIPGAVVSLATGLNTASAGIGDLKGE